MYTQKSRKLQEETGLIDPERLRALIVGLRARSEDAKARADQEEPDSYLAAALRGRKLGYMDAIQLIQNVIDNKPLHTRRDSSARRKSREWWQRREERRGRSIRG